MRNFNTRPVINIEKTGKNIKSLMDVMNVSTREMAEALNVSYQAVHGYIKGRKLPTLNHLVIMSIILKRSIEELIVIDIITVNE